MAERSKAAATRKNAPKSAGALPDRHLFVRDLVLKCQIGVYPHEKGGVQRVRLNVDLAVEDDGRAEDNIHNVVSYEDIVGVAKRLIDDGHINLVETLAERIAAALLKDRRVVSARVRVEKLDVFPEAASVGVEIERRRADRR
jgi:dihydroneopterin aldolase